jgi:hypothetical protein
MAEFALSAHPIVMPQVQGDQGKAVVGLQSPEPVFPQVITPRARGALSGALRALN